MRVRTYSELSDITTFEERYEYLRLNGTVGADTFGFDRYLNQKFYRSKEWKEARDRVVARDLGNDLGIVGRPIGGSILIHHMNPISLKDIAEKSGKLLDPEYLVCVSKETHNAIHYGDDHLLMKDPVARVAGDTCPWKKR